MGMRAAAVLVVCLAASALPAQATPSLAPDAALSTFTALCLGGDMAPAAVLSRADASGWSKTKPKALDTWDPDHDRASGSGDETFILAAWEAGQAQFCTIGARQPTAGWVDALTAWLRLEPDVSAPTKAHSSTYFVVRADQGWRPAAALAAADLARAKETGLYYSFVASDGVHSGDDSPAATFMVAHAKTTEAGRRPSR